MSISPAPFLFAAVPKKELPRIAVEGLSPQLVTYETLKEARKAGGRILVVTRKAVEKGVVRPKDVLNLMPFRRAVPIDAGGGVILRGRGKKLETVLIFRRGKWDIPKGKRDRGETKRECAVREVQEELGIDDVRIVAKIGSTVHGYRSRKRRFLVKNTHWYIMKSDAKAFTPQAAEQITDARWVRLDDALEMVGYKGLKRVLKQTRAIVQTL